MTGLTSLFCALIRILTKVLSPNPAAAMSLQGLPGQVCSALASPSLLPLQSQAPPPPPLPGPLDDGSRFPSSTGVWAQALGEMAGVQVPLVAMHHAYVVTEKIEGVQVSPWGRGLSGEFLSWWADKNVSSNRCCEQFRYFP